MIIGGSTGSLENSEAETFRINDQVSNYLKKIAEDFSTWSILYQDPIDSRFWELTLLQSEYHGGGVKRLTCISRENVKKKYGI